MEQIDLKKELKQLYKPSSKQPEIIEVPEYQFLQINGIDAREDNPVFQEAIQALFGISYKTKFQIKNEKDIDYKVMPLEGLWCADSMDDFLNNKKENWQWTLMIMQPDFVTQVDIEYAKEAMLAKTNPEILTKVKFNKFKEGLSAQIMHIGPFSEEHDNIQKIHKLITNNSGRFNGKVHKHHEIYLSDFRRTAPDKLRTIIRQPFQKITN